jgi:hypothetical protein
MAECRSQGKTLLAIARDLNRLNIRPARGREWYASSVRGQLVAVDNKSPALRRG